MVVLDPIVSYVIYLSRYNSRFTIAFNNIQYIVYHIVPVEFMEGMLFALKFRIEGGSIITFRYIEEERSGQMFPERIYILLFLLKRSRLYASIPLILILLFFNSVAYSYSFPGGSDYVSAYGGVVSQPSQYYGVFQETQSDSDSGHSYATASGSLNNQHPFWDSYGGTYGTTGAFGDYIRYNGSFSAYASAGTGKIGVFATAEGSAYNGFGVTSPNWGGSASATARIVDSIFYSGVTTAFPVLVEWDVDGIFNGGGSAETLFNATVGGPDYLITGQPWEEPYERRDDITDGMAYFARTLWIDPNNTGYTHPNPNAAPYDPFLLTVSGSLSVSVRNGTANFSNTGAFTISYPEGLPEGTIYESSSGIFLTETPQVPIPGAIWLLSSGVAGLVGIRRKLNK